MSNTESTGQFRLMVVEGIKGGFAPPKVRSAVEVEGDNSGAVIVHATEADGQLSNERRRLTAEEAQAFAKKIREDLSALPRQPDPPTQDWYDMDVGIEFSMDGFYWSNGASSGCGHVPHEEQLSINSKQQFGDVVQYLQELAADRAEHPSDKDIV
ncbi:hypothetical protein BDF22DRAFT_739250 [Syncephalis plumigaleata]|nr:hypothetical protein BDF22DRAFT_739250 [Syncephalis plumigaleata]